MIRSRIRPARGQKIYFGWYIVAIAFIANFMSVGTGFYALNAFMEPLCDIRGWTRTDINLAPVMGTIFGFFAQFVYGTLMVRLRIRHLMICGTVTAGIAFMLLIRTPVLWQFYILYVLLFLGNGAYGGIVANTAISNWFRNKRGNAMGIATAGISLSGAVLPLVAMIIILRWGMVRMALWISMSIIMVGILAWLIVRDWPESYGLLPDGADGEALGPSEQHFPEKNSRPDTVWTLPMLVRTNTFWKAGFAFALLMTGAVGVMSQLKPRFADIGFDDMTAMLLMTSTALVATIGKYTWGMLCDRFEPRHVAAVLAGANALGLVPSLFHDAILAVVLFILIFGFAMGGIMSTYPIIVADLFGRMSFPAVSRFMALFLILQMSGYIVAGQSYDLLGSYDAAYGLYIIFDIVAACLLVTIRRPVPVLSSVERWDDDEKRI